MSNTSQWSQTAGSNNSDSPDGWPEGMPPSGVNDSGREVMAAIARDREQTDGSLATGGSANAYTITTTNAHQALSDIGLVFARVHAANTGASTLAVDGLTAKSVVSADGTAMVSGDLALNGVYGFLYDSNGDRFIVVAATKEVPVVVQYSLTSPQAMTTSFATLDLDSEVKGHADIDSDGSGVFTLNNIDTYLVTAYAVSSKESGTTNPVGPSIRIRHDDGGGYSTVFTAKGYHLEWTQQTLSMAAVITTTSADEKVLIDGYHRGGGSYVQGQLDADTNVVIMRL